MDKIFGILFILLSLLLGKFILFPDKSKQAKPAAVAKVAPRPRAFVSDDPIVVQIVDEANKIEEIQFAKNQINFIDIKFKDDEVLKNQIQKAFEIFFFKNKAAPYYLEVEAFRNPESDEMIIQSSIFDRAKSNKIQEFGIKILSVAEAPEKEVLDKPLDKPQPMPLPTEKK